MGEDDLRSTFERLRAAPMPVRALTADDVIRDGEAVRKRRRTMAVVGSGVGTTAIVVAAVLVLALKPAGAPTGPVEPAGPSGTTSVTPPAPTSRSVTPLPEAPVESSLTRPPPIPSTTSPSALPPETSAPVPTTTTSDPTPLSTEPTTVTRTG